MWELLSNVVDFSLDESVQQFPDVSGTNRVLAVNSVVHGKPVNLAVQISINHPPDELHAGISTAQIMVVGNKIWNTAHDHTAIGLIGGANNVPVFAIGWREPLVINEQMIGHDSIQCKRLQKIDAVKDLMGSINANTSLSDDFFSIHEIAVNQCLKVRQHFPKFNPTKFSDLHFVPRFATTNTV